MANTWNKAGTTWGYNSWESDTVTVSLTGLGLTTSLGTPLAFPEQGWGSDTWGMENWGQSGLDEIITAPSALTASVGTPTITAEVNVGWGQDGWGVENWGQSGLRVIVDVESSGELTTNVGASGWGEVSWGNNGWGTFTLNPADVQGLSGQASTSSVGSPDIIVDFTGTLTAPSALTSSVGSISPTEMAIGLSSAGVATTAVGALDPADVVGLTGLSLSTDVGEITVASVELIDVDGVGATTSVGSVIIETAYLISGQIATSAVGSISPTEMTVGLTGVEATTAIGSVSPLGYFNIDITGNTSYNDIDITGNTSYTDVA
tara:strand:- start:1537 stop:2493 length:957 start_codon:yes stop_codon:yes gene_type:complete